jgi:hypothetical protein
MIATPPRLRAEISDLRAYIGGLPEALRKGPYGEVYRLRLHELLDELSIVELVGTADTESRPAMDLRVSAVDGTHRLPAQLLSELLKGWQGLVWSLGQAVAGKPTTRGQIPQDVIRQTTLDVVAFAEGSFIARMVLEHPEQLNAPGVSDDLGAAALREFETLWQTGTTHHELTVIMHRLKGRVLSSYEQFLQLLSKTNTDLRVTFAEPQAQAFRRVHLSRESVAAVLAVLTSVGKIEETRLETVVGVLNNAHRRSRNFELDLPERGCITGRIVEDQLLDGLVIGRIYECTLEQATTKNPLTDESETSYTLVSAKPLPTDSAG